MENQTTQQSRVVSVEIYQPRNRRRSEKSPEYYPVYDIEVEENHNFFAENVLVHNCGYIRRKKRDVLKQLPKLSKHVVPIPIERPEEYEEAERDFSSWLKKDHPQKAKRALKAEQLAKSGYLLRLTAKLKMAAVEEWIDCFLRDSDEKLCVFAIHKATIGRLREKYKERCVWVDGSVAPEKRKEKITEFQRRKQIRLFLGNVQAAGVGMDGLQLCCSTGLLIEYPWTPPEVEQVMGRLDRIGQKKPVAFHLLVGNGTIEERMCKLLQKRQDSIDDVLDGRRAKDLSIYDALLKTLKEKK